MRIRGENESARNRSQGAADAGGIFVAEHSEDDRGALAAELFPPGFRQDLRAGEIVGAVDNDALIPALKARGPWNVGETSHDRVFRDGDFAGAQRGKGERSVLLLMRAHQADGSRCVGLAHKRERRVAFGGAGTDDFFGRGFLLRGNHRQMRLDDPGFFPGDFFQRVSQPFLMVVPDRGEHGNDGRDGIGRIQPSAEAGLEHDQFAIVLLEMIQGQRGRNFKKCRMRVPSADHLSNGVETVRHFRLPDHFAVYANAFAVADEVRGGEETGAIAGRATDRIDHRADRAFAVGAGDVDDPLVFCRKVQLAKKTLNVF